MSVRLVNVDAGIELTLTDDLRHSRFCWPASRISVPLEFVDGPTSLGEVMLRSLDDDEQVGFQLTDDVWVSGHLAMATLYVLTDLSSGSTRHFLLGWGTRRFRVPKISNAVTVHREGALMVLENGLVRFELPAVDMSSSSSGGVLAPIQRFGDSNSWLGRTRFIVPEAPTCCSVQWPTVGPLFSECALTYEFPGDRSYRIVIRLCAGMEFVELDEHIEGFTQADDAALVFDIDGTEFTHQYCANRPADPTYRSWPSWAPGPPWPTGTPGSTPSSTSAIHTNKSYKCSSATPSSPHKTQYFSQGILLGSVKG